VHKLIVIEYQGLQMDQASHLRRQTVQIIVTEVQVQQVSEVDEQLIRYVINAVRKQTSENGFRLTFMFTDIHG